MQAGRDKSKKSEMVGNSWKLNLFDEIYCFFPPFLGSVAYSQVSLSIFDCWEKGQQPEFQAIPGYQTQYQILKPGTGKAETGWKRWPFEYNSKSAKPTGCVFYDMFIIWFTSYFFEFWYNKCCLGVTRRDALLVGHRERGHCNSSCHRRGERDAWRG